MQLTKFADLLGFSVGFALSWTACNARSPNSEHEQAQRGALEKPTTLRAMYALKPPQALYAAQTALVLVDFQDEFVDGRLKLPGAQPAIEHAVALATWARRAGILVVLVKNVSTRPASPVFAADSKTTAFVAQLAPHPEDVVLQKATGGAFSHTNFDADLHARGIDTLIIGGLMTHLAVSMTASDATVLGYHVVVAADATATRDLPGAGDEAAIDAESLQRAALDTMADRVADVMLGEQITGLPVIRP